MNPKNTLYEYFKEHYEEHYIPYDISPSAPNIAVIMESDYFKGLERIPYGELIKHYALSVITAY